MAGSVVESGAMAARIQTLECDEAVTVAVSGAGAVAGVETERETPVGPDSATPAASPAPAPFSEFRPVSASESVGTPAAEIDSWPSEVLAQVLACDFELATEAAAVSWRGSPVAAVSATVATVAIVAVAYDGEPGEESGPQPVSDDRVGGGSAAAIVAEVAAMVVVDAPALAGIAARKLAVSVAEVPLVELAREIQLVA